MPQREHNINAYTKFGTPNLHGNIFCWTCEFLWNNWTTLVSQTPVKVDKRPGYSQECMPLFYGKKSYMLEGLRHTEPVRITYTIDSSLPITEKSSAVLIEGMDELILADDLQVELQLLDRTGKAVEEWYLEGVKPISWNMSCFGNIFTLDLVLQYIKVQYYQDIWA